MGLFHILIMQQKLIYLSLNLNWWILLFALNFTGSVLNWIYFNKRQNKMVDSPLIQGDQIIFIRSLFRHNLSIINQTQFCMIISLRDQ